MNTSDSTSNDIQFWFCLKCKFCQIQIFDFFWNFLYYVLTIFIQNDLRVEWGHRLGPTRTSPGINNENQKGLYISFSSMLESDL